MYEGNERIGNSLHKDHYMKPNMKYTIKSTINLGHLGCSVG